MMTTTRFTPRGAITGAVLGATMLLAACVWGTPAKKYPPAVSPAGARIAFRLEGERRIRRAELISVDSVALLVLDSLLYRVAWERINALEASGAHARFSLPRPAGKTPEYRARLALISRHPQGLSEALLAEALARLGQRAVLDLP